MFKTEQNNPFDVSFYSFFKKNKTEANRPLVV